MKLLQQLAEFKKKPFYSNGIKNEQDKKDSAEYYSIEENIENLSKKLKKGDKVIFNFPKKVKTTAKEKAENIARYGNFMSGFKFVDDFIEGEVYKPFFNKKRTRFGETDLIPTITVSSGKFLYPVSPRNICKL